MIRNIIQQYADQIFNKNDSNMSGFLDVNEIQTAVAELYQSNGLPPPPREQVITIMRTFD